APAHKGCRLREGSRLPPGGCGMMPFHRQKMVQWDRINGDNPLNKCKKGTVVFGSLRSVISLIPIQIGWTDTARYQSFADNSGVSYAHQQASSNPVVWKNLSYSA